MLSVILLGLTLGVFQPEKNEVPAGGSSLRNQGGAIDPMAWRANVDVDALGQVLGYWNVQETVFERVAKEFPTLADRAQKLREQAQQKLGPGVEEIRNACKAKVPDWSGVDRELSKQSEGLRGVNLTELEAKAFLDQLEAGIKGELESPIGETLASFQPAFIADPMAEVRAGYLTAISTAFEPRALGLKLALHRPMSWVVFDSGAETIPLAMRSYAGHGDAMGMLFVRKLDEKQIRDLEKDGIASLVDYQTSIKQQNGRFIGQGPAKVAGHDGQWVRYILDRVQDQTFVRIHTWGFHFVEKDVYASFQWQIAETADTKEGLPSDEEMKSRHEFFEPLFQELTDHMEIVPEEP